MNLATLILIACSLSMDAFAVAIASGVTIKELQIRHAFKIAFFFGAFQALMPSIGWLAGGTLKTYLGHYDRLIAFALLSVIGGKMIYEARELGDKSPANPLHTVTLLFLALATSIDALAVGLSLSLLQVLIIFPVIIIGLVTFCLSFAGVFIGNKIGHLFENKLEIFAGLVLIGIGLKILLGG